MVPSSLELTSPQKKRSVFRSGFCAASERDYTVYFLPGVGNRFP